MGHFKRECPKKPVAVYPLGSVGDTCVHIGGDPCMKGNGGKSCDQAAQEVLHGDVVT